MKERIGILFLLISTLTALGQVAPNKYFITFTDKKNSEYSINNPEEFLSPRALERRTRYNIKIDLKDIPVTKAYKDSIGKFPVTIISETKWFNGVVIEIIDSFDIRVLENLSFVQSIHFNDSSSQKNINSYDYPYQHFQSTIKSDISYRHLSVYSELAQVELFNGIQLHEQGFKGEGMHVAVIDAGFFGVDSLPAFQHLWDNNQILGLRDFTNFNANLFEENTHGMYVLSVMGADLPGMLYGTAPKASYWLLRSEVVSTEYMIEELFWVAAAEFADSVGADVINSSLGYYKFDNPEQNYSYNDMNGEVAFITRAADIASAKGILTITSAGNEGNDEWKYITSPADANSVLTVGSVDYQGIYSSFSSIGPTYDNRIKPNVVAMGEGVFLQHSDGGTRKANGTSFSAPMAAGLATCLWQAYPEMNNMEIIHSIERSASQYSYPDAYLGYGIPDFSKAHTLLNIQKNEDESSSLFAVYPTMFDYEINIQLGHPVLEELQFRIYNMAGELVYSRSQYVKSHEQDLRLTGLGDLMSGTYVIAISGKQESHKSLIIRK